MRKETHVRNSHKWTRYATLGFALTVTSFVAAPAATVISHNGGALVASASSTMSSSIHTDSWKWT